MSSGQNVNLLIDEVEERIRFLMGWDLDKVNRWLDTENPMLGGSTPLEMICSGRGYKVIKMIEEAERTNKGT